MPPKKASSTGEGLSEYEIQRNKNLEENRRILESIRQEQLYAFGDIQPAVKKDKEPKKKKKKVVRTTEPSDEAKEEGGDENAGPNQERRRKSARLSGKKPRYSALCEGGGDDSNDEDFDSEAAEDSDDEEFEDDDGVSKGNRKKKRPSSMMPRGPRPKIVIPKDRENFYGPVPGVPVGKIWETRMECCADGVHRPTVAGIHGGPEGAYSISLAGGYEDDVDLGDCFTYTGEGGRALKGTKNNPKNLRTAPQSKDQTLTRGNLALSLSVESRRPVRVIRGAKLNNEFAPEYGYRYDGLYTVEKYWSCVGKSGYKVYKFALNRCPDQVPPPWVTGPLPPEVVATSTEEDEDDDDEDAVQKPTVLRVKLFNK